MFDPTPSAAVTICFPIVIFCEVVPLDNNAPDLIRQLFRQLIDSQLLEIRLNHLHAPGEAGQQKHKTQNTKHEVQRTKDKVQVQSPTLY
jgi:hypothetical protein